MWAINIQNKRINMHIHSQFKELKNFPGFDQVTKQFHTYPTAKTRSDNSKIESVMVFIFEKNAF